MTYGYVPCPFSPAPCTKGVLGRESLRNDVNSLLDDEFDGTVS